MAPSTPPPPRSEVFAALTMASTSSRVMSPTTISRRVPWASAARTGASMPRIVRGLCAARRASGELLAHIERALAAERGKILLEKAVGSGAADVAQMLEERPLDVELRARGHFVQFLVGRDAVKKHPPIAGLAGESAQKPAFDQAAHEADGAEFGNQRGVEGDLVDAVQDVARGLWRFLALDWVRLH